LLLTLVNDFRINVKDMEKYVRVSQVLACLQDFSQIDPAVLEAKQNIGINVHDGIDQYLNGMFPLLFLSELNYLTSFLKWKAKTNPKVKVTEKRYYCDDKMLTGQVDALMQFPHSQLTVLVDWKTSAVESPKIWPLQAHLYHYLVNKNTLFPLADFALFVKLDPKGNIPKVYPYKIDKNTTDYALSLVDEYWKRNPVKS
jgi:hypothetical protein